MSEGINIESLDEGNILTKIARIIKVPSRSQQDTILESEINEVSIAKEHRSQEPSVSSNLYGNESFIASGKFEGNKGICSEISGNSPQPQSKYMSILVGVFVAVGGFLFGYDSGLINNILDMKYVDDHLSPNRSYFTSEEQSILVSFLSLGTFVGALAAPLISDSFGRKITIIMSVVGFFFIGNSLQVAATNIQLLIAGRVISGLGIGLISAVVPLYQGEAAHKCLRGTIISTYQWAITWGLLVSSAVSQGTHRMDSANSYRIPIGLQYVWSFVLATGMLFLPESPRFYVFKDELDKAAKSLSFLRGVSSTDPDLLEELVEIKATYDYEKSFGSSTVLDCFRSSETRPKQTLRMLTGISLQACQQFSGINFIFYYGVNFFNKSGIHGAYLVSFITYAVNVGFTIPGLFLVEYIGRRKVLIFGGIIMTMCNFIIAIVGVSTNSVVGNKVMIAFICLFIASFSSTWGGCVWVISAELYPLGVRSKCTAICAASNWLINFICSLITPYIVDTGDHTSSIGPKIFFIWGSLNAVGVILAQFAVYETKGLTLEEINELYEISPDSLQSTKWNEIIRKRSLNCLLDSSYDSRSRALHGNGYEPHPVASSAPSPITTKQELMGVNELSVSGINHPAGAYVDLGNGLGLNAYQRGPPSILSDSSDEEDREDRHFDSSIHKNKPRVSEYMTFLMDSYNHDLK